MIRASVIVFGGILALQSSDRLTGPKIAYLLAAGTSLAFALPAATQAIKRGQLERRLAAAAVVFALVVGASVVLAIANGNSLTVWLRDVAPYLLFAATPFIATDLRRSASDRQILILLATAGLMTAAAFSSEWLGRREAGDFALNDFLLPSFLLPAALVAAAVTRPDRAAARAGWVGLAGLTLVLMATTLTRTTVILFTAPIVGIVLLRDRVRRLQDALALVAILVLFVTAALVGLRAIGADTWRLEARLRALPSVLTDPNADQSFSVRRDDVRVALKGFRDAPVFGQAPGRIYQVSGPTRTRVSGAAGSKKTFILDTGLGFLTKFGLIGVLALGLFVAALIGQTRRAQSPHGLAALAGYLAIGALFLPFAVPIEDKGFSFGMLLLLALALPPGPPVRRLARGRRGERPERGSASPPLGPEEVSAAAESPPDVVDHPPTAETPVRPNQESEDDRSIPPIRSAPVPAGSTRSAASRAAGLEVDSTVRERLRDWRVIAGMAAGVAITLLLIAIIGFVREDGSARGPESSALPRGFVTPPAVDPTEARALAEARVREWAYLTCGESCAAISVIPRAHPLWEFRVTFANGGERCHLLDLDRVARGGGALTGIEFLRCDALAEFHPTPDEELAALRVRQWAIYNCIAPCSIVALRKVDETLWEFEIVVNNQQQCYLLDSSRFEAFAGRFGGIWPLACELPQG